MPLVELSCFRILCKTRFGESMMGATIARMPFRVSHAYRHGDYCTVYKQKKQGAKAFTKRFCECFLNGNFVKCAQSAHDEVHTCHNGVFALYAQLSHIPYAVQNRTAEIEVKDVPCNDRVALSQEWKQVR